MALAAGVLVEHSITIDSVLDATKARATELLGTLQTWVMQNSHTYNPAGVNKMGALLEADFAIDGLSLTRMESAVYGHHLVWRTPAAQSEAPIVIVGHHDTVFPPGVFDGFRREGDRAHGPGVLDMKGGLAIVRTALAAFSDCGVLADLPLLLVSVSDEEVGSPESRQHLRTAAQGARAALVFEAGRTGDKIITQRKGSGAVVATARGKAAHSGNHHREGKNAIWALADFVCRVQRLTEYDRGLTVNVGLIKGGTSRNTVPGEATCEVDLRFERADDAASVLAKIDAAARETAQAVAGTTITVDGGVKRPPWERTVASRALCAEYGACQREAGLGNGEAALIGGGSDGNTVAPMGIATIDGLGPRGAGFHTSDEYIEVSSLAMKTETLVRFLWRQRPSA